MCDAVRRIGALVVLFLVSAGAAPSPPGRIKQVNGIPLALLSSAYVHVEDSGDASPAPERWAVLVFHPSGAAFLMLGSGKPQEDKAYEAAFLYANGVLDLRFTSRESARSASFPLDLAASEVTMPFRVFSAEEGTSRWKRDGSDDRLLDNVSSLCGAIVLARRVDPDSTTVLLAKYLEPFVRPAGGPEVDVSPAPRILSMTDFQLTAGTLGFDLERPDGPESFSGIFHSCFAGIRSYGSSSPCSGRARMRCTRKGCRCMSGQRGVRVIAGKTTVTGSCEGPAIDQVISRNLNVVRYCYLLSLSEESRSTGRITGSFTIDSKGAVGEAKVAKSTLNQSAIEQCIITRLQKWRFPKPEAGGDCTVNFAFDFKYAKEDE